MATVVPHLEPDSFDDDINALLADPGFVAELDRRRAAVESGSAKLYTSEEVRQRLLGRGVPVNGDFAHDR